jgi:hypothetical protein
MTAIARVIFLLAALAACTAFADMMKDSPVKFPKDGPIPAKYAPDIKRENEASEPGYFLFETPERSLAQINKIQGEMPAGRFTPPATDWRPLARARRVLSEGGDLHILAFGDSIINDTMRSGWLAKLGEAYPKARIRGTVYVRGGGGCQHYLQENRIARFIAPRKPDLVLIGGISQRDPDDVRQCIRYLRGELPGVEILLMSGAFGSNIDPRSPVETARAPYSGTGPYGEQLRRIAAGERCAYLDLTAPWAEYINASKLHPHLFYRDPVHANEYGEQILARILLSFFRIEE